MKKKAIGVYECGYEQIELVLREGTGGEFYYIPENGALPRIKVGADYGKWSEVVAVLLHEVFEFCMDRARCRFDPSSDVGHDHSAYLFVMNHPIFHDCCERSSEFMTSALPDLAKEWNRWKGKKK